MHYESDATNWRGQLDIIRCSSTGRSRYPEQNCTKCTYFRQNRIKRKKNQWIAEFSVHLNDSSATAIANHMVQCIEPISRVKHKLIIRHFLTFMLRTIGSNQDSPSQTVICRIHSLIWVDVDSCVNENGSRTCVICIVISFILFFFLPSPEWVNNFEHFRANRMYLCGC